MLIILKTIRVKRYCYFSMKVLDEIETSARFSQLPIQRLQSLVVLLKKMLGADRRIVDYAQEAKIRTGPLLDTTSHSRGVNKKLKYITYNKAGGQQKKKAFSSECLRISTKQEIAIPFLVIRALKWYRTVATVPYCRMQTEVL